MGRPRIDIDQKLFVRLYCEGFTDGVIASMLGVSRSTVIRTRQRLNLDPVCSRGCRGLGKTRPDKSYYAEVARVMASPELNRMLYAAARKVREKGHGGTLSYLATLVHPAPLPRYLPGYYCTPADRLNVSHIQNIVAAEQKMERAMMAGVPGPAVFALARLAKRLSKAKESQIVEQLAVAAVSQACMVGVYEKVHEVIANLERSGSRSYASLEVRWQEAGVLCREWAPIRDETRTGVAQLRSRSREGCSRTGKLGKQGGIGSARVGQAMAAVQRY